MTGCAIVGWALAHRRSAGGPRPTLLRFRTILLFAALCLLPWTQADGSGDLDRAWVFFDRAQRPGVSSADQMAWLEQSLAASPTFLAAYELGKLQRQRLDPGGALASFETAFGLTGQDEYLARAAYQIGITHQRTGRHVDARRWLRRSLGIHDHQAVRAALRQLELSRAGRVVPAAEILDELKVERTFGVARTELRVHFALDRASLDRTGRRQAVELGKALGDRRWQSQTFLLLGHTDRQCPRGQRGALGCDRHNLELSRDRAETVRRVLTRELGLAAGRVRAAGCGRAHPLSRQAAEEDHYLNRRVVVLAIEPGAVDRDRLCAQDSGLL